MTGFTMNGGGGGGLLPPLTTPAEAGDIRAGKQAIDKDGQIITGTVMDKAAQTYTPSTVVQTVAAGQYLAGDQTISAIQTQTKTVTPTGAVQTVTPASGKYLTQVTVQGITPSFDSFVITPSTKNVIVTPELSFTPYLLVILHYDETSSTATVLMGAYFLRLGTTTQDFDEAAISYNDGNLDETSWIMNPACEVDWEYGTNNNQIRVEYMDSENMLRTNHEYLVLAFGF